MSFLHTVRAARARVSQTRPACDNCDIATTEGPAHPPVCRNVATVAAPPSLQFECDDQHAVIERAAIMAVEGGLPDGWADALAAILCDPRPTNVSRQHWADLHDPILRFADQHAAQLAELGWTLEELFGAPANWNRMDQRGIGWSICQGEIVRATSQTITFIRDGARFTHTKQQRANHASLESP